MRSNGRGRADAVRTDCVIQPMESRFLLSSTSLSSILNDLTSTLSSNGISLDQVISTLTTTSTPKAPAALGTVGTVSGTTGQLPYNRAPIPVTRYIQAELFDRGGERVAYHDSTAKNLFRLFRTTEAVDVATCQDAGGGYAVSQTIAGEWMEYTISVPTAGWYDVVTRVASAGAGGAFHYTLDGSRLTPNMTVPNTGGWQRWANVTSSSFYLPAGLHVLRMVMDSVGAKGITGSFNWMRFRVTPPAAPSDLTAVTASPFEIRLNWQDGSDNEYAFAIERKIGDDGVWEQVATVGADETTFLDTNLTANTDFFYRVRATNSAGKSNYTNEASAVTDLAGPIVITSGGTYSGSWQSLDPDVPAVLIETDEPVIIENSIIRSRGHLIFGSWGYDANITVRNTQGYGLNPEVAGRHVGRFLDVEQFVNVVVENNYLDSTAGIYLYNYTGDHTDQQTITVLRNQAINIDGRMSDGDGGFLPYAEEDWYVQFFQVNDAVDLRGAEIAWNQVVNEPDLSLVEDNISIYASSGTSDSPIRIHDNYIKGGYPLDPANNSDYSGGGIMLSDGGSCWVSAYNNQIISTTNHGLAITSGNNNEIYNNRVVSSGRLPDGSETVGQNVGIYIWNLNPDVEFYNNIGRDNIVGWVLGDGRNDWWVPDATSWTNNRHWSGTPTAATEANEWVVWQNKLNSNSISVGVS